MARGPPTRGATENNTVQNGSTARETIVETLPDTKFTGIATEEFVNFKQAHELYERHVAEKNNEDGIEMQLTSCRSSIHDSSLALMESAKWVNADKVEDITEEQLKKCVHERSQINPDDYDLAMIERGIAYVKLGASKKNLKIKVWELDVTHASVPKSLGHSKFIENQPELAVKKF